MTAPAARRGNGMSRRHPQHFGRRPGPAPVRTRGVVMRLRPKLRHSAADDRLGACIEAPATIALRSAVPPHRGVLDRHTAVADRRGCCWRACPPSVSQLPPGRRQRPWHRLPAATGWRRWRRFRPASRVRVPPPTPTRSSKATTPRAA
jgi:hypothetical protein